MFQKIFSGWLVLWITYELIFGQESNCIFRYLVVESSESQEEAYLTQDSESYYLQNKINAVPLLIGTNVDDGLIFASKRESYGATIPEHITPQTAVPEMIKISDNKEYEEVGRKIIQFYYGNETPSRRNLDKYARVRFYSVCYKTFCKIELIAIIFFFLVSEW